MCSSGCHEHVLSVSIHNSLHSFFFLGDGTMTMKVHMLRHIPMCVQNFGPLWVFSCFPYESTNGFIKSMVHGTRYIAAQVRTSPFLKLEETLGMKFKTTKCYLITKRCHVAFVDGFHLNTPKHLYCNI